MDIQCACAQLSSQSEAIIALASGLTHEEARWHPNPESWSVLIVMCHLVDEEILDFRSHIDHILHTPDEPWPQIDPVGWVTEKRYANRNLSETIEQFSAERYKSITWLKAIKNPDWEVSVNLPWGPLSAGIMLASWLAHDLLHLRQLTALRYDLTQATCQPYSVQNAGEW